MIYSINRVLSSVNFVLTLDITRKLSLQIISYLSWTFCATLNGLDIGLGSQGHRKTNGVGPIFSHTPQKVMIKFEVMLKLFKLNVSKLLSVNFSLSKKIAAAFLFQNKTLTVAYTQTFMKPFLSNLV